MSERRKIGDKVMVKNRRGAEAYVCLVTNGHGNDKPHGCIKSHLNRLDNRGGGCVDPDCREWATLKVLKVLKPESDHYAENEFLYHVSECEMIGARGGHDG